MENFINVNLLQLKKKLPSNQSGIIELAKFTCSLLGRAFQKGTKAIAGQEQKQTKIHLKTI